VDIAERTKLSAIVAKHVQSAEPWIAAQAISDFAQINVRYTRDSRPEKLNEILQSYLHGLLNNNGMSEAASILWTPTQFTAGPNSVKSVWELFESSSAGLIMGAAALGKSFSMGVRLMLEWIRDPEYTGIRVIGPSEDHLEQNLFSHLVSLHAQASLPMPGEVGDLFIGTNRRNQTAAIRGIVVPKGNNKKAGRLQGGHRKPRPKPHPIFGPLTRMFIFIDEIENVPAGIWHDVGNVLSEVGPDGGFKIFGAYNPTNLGDEVAKQAEPPFGWPNVDVNIHYKWKSTRGWDVIRLDAEKCENVIAGKVIYPGLQTREGLAKIALSSGGTQSAGYYTMGRGMYPQQGMQATLIPSGMLEKSRAKFIWYDDKQVRVGGCDLALEGGDDAVYALGKWGLATGIQYPPTLEKPDGFKIMFKDEKGRVRARHGLQIESLMIIPKGDTVAIKDRIIKFNKNAGVRPEFFACDRTGVGAGAADLIRHEWSPSIHDINYSSGASDSRIMSEHSKTCADEYDRLATEIWFRLRFWLEFGFALFDPGMDMSKVGQQLTQRRQLSSGSKAKIESKRDYESRGFASPNEADAITLLVHAAHRGSGVTPSMDGGSQIPENPWEDDWPHSGMQGGVKIDLSNRSDWLDDRPESAEPGEFAIL